MSTLIMSSATSIASPLETAPHAASAAEVVSTTVAEEGNSTEGSHGLGQTRDPLPQPRRGARSRSSMRSSAPSQVSISPRNSAIIHKGSRCRIVQASQILVVKQPHPLRAADRGVSSEAESDIMPGASGAAGEEISQHEWDHFLKNEAQHRWEVHIYEMLQEGDSDGSASGSTSASARAVYHRNILLAPYTSENGIYMLHVGDNLERRMARASTSPVCDFQRIQWIHGVTRALAWLESKKLVYCNLAPRHVLLYPPSSPEDGGEPLLCDFAMTERAGGSMPTRYDLRDFRFLSPWADERTAETDIWSLGCLGYFLVTGQAPFAELQHRRAMGLLEERWHPDFWNGEASILIPFVSRCWYCEHCAPRGNLTAFQDVRDAARYWDNLTADLVNERPHTSCTPLCRLEFHEKPVHIQSLERHRSRNSLFVSPEIIYPLMMQAKKIDEGNATSVGSGTRSVTSSRRCMERPPDDRKTIRAETVTVPDRDSADAYMWMMAVGGAVAATAVMTALYSRFIRSR
ncbi:hypothetical protein KEM52_000180 [Ascosphaera acerosa]|nr:hypothetical protein KEM52_000180 [Ascosphaera acerosa]